MSEPEHPLITEFRRFSPTSELFANRAGQVFPGGDTRSSAHYAPYPLAMDRASGTVMTDVDGNKIVDFMNNFTSLIHGHAYPPVVEAVQKQVALGSAYAAPSLSQVELAELIVERVPSVEQLRFTSSGTEGTQMAIRCARAATGRQKIMKMEGGYHGSYELAEVSLVPRPNECGPLEEPTSTAVDASFPDSVLKDTVICPYNQPAIARDLLQQYGDDIAAVIVEPMLGSMGMVQATTEFLTALREETSARGIVLIFDEVITFRLDRGGAQSLHRVIPDLTCMGKIIGGGLPVGAIGGKRELLQLFSPDQENPVMHASTFSGNALTMAAGFAAVKSYTDDKIERANLLGERLRQGFNNAFEESGLRMSAIGQGSLTNLHFTESAIKDARDSISAIVEGGHIARLLHLSMLRNGILSATRLMYCINTAMDESHVDKAIAAMNASLYELKPYIEQERSNLLVS